MSGQNTYLFVTLAVVWTLFWLKERGFPAVLGHLDQPHGCPDGGVPGMDEHHHLRADRSVTSFRVCDLCVTVVVRLCNL